MPPAAHGVVAELKLYETGGHGFARPSELDQAMVGRFHRVVPATGASQLPLEPQSAPQPNIVHIIDDLGWQDIASHKIDGEPVETPHMDQLTSTDAAHRLVHRLRAAPRRGVVSAWPACGQYRCYHVSGGRIPRAWHPDSTRIAPYYLYGLPPRNR